MPGRATMQSGSLIQNRPCWNARETPFRVAPNWPGIDASPLNGAHVGAMSGDTRIASTSPIDGSCGAPQPSRYASPITSRINASPAR